MRLTTTTVSRVFAVAAFALATFASMGAAAPKKAQVPTLSDMSPAGMRAAMHSGINSEGVSGMLPEGASEAAQAYVSETREMGLVKRSGTILVSGPPNVRANNPAGDRVGETQAEVAVAVNGDTVVIGWNDSQGFLAGQTVSSYGYSTNGGATFVDGGNIPLAAAGDQAFGDPGVDTDERGNWYYNQIYTRAGPQQNIGVHHGRFNGAGVLVWDLPTQASIGTAATGNLDKCLLACDRVTGNVYVAYTRFTANPQIEIVRSTTLGVSWDPPIVLDNSVVPTSSKQGARPFCGPAGEVYVVWEKGANTIFCPDPGTGDVPNSTGTIGFTRSLNFGVSYDPFTQIGTVEHSWTWSGPGDLRERANEFPDIAVDMSNGCYRGNIYVTWHESAPWLSNLAAGPVVAEANDAANNNPTGPELFAVGNDATGTMSSVGDLDYWQFNATQGQSYLFNLDPAGFVCGVVNAAGGMRMRLFAVTNPFPNPNGFPDSLLAASALGAFAQRITWTAPRTGPYLVRLQRSSGTTPFGYVLRVRNLAFGAPSPGRDARDVVVIRSSNQGLAWSAEQRINDDPAGLEERRPFIAVNSSGQVTAYWHDSREAGFGSTASLTEVWGTLSRDGGATWSPNFAVTDEASFFSFNTIAVPNLGDYNQAAGGRTTAVFHPAWSDQRISTGDVRTPGTNTFTAGRGPETYTTGISFFNGILCPPDTIGNPGTSVVRRFRLSNTGTVPDNYNYSITDNAGWIGGPINGSSGIVQPGSFFDVFVTVNIPSDCNPPVDILTLSVLPVGEGCYAPQTCQTRVLCDLATPALVQSFGASVRDGGVDLDWTSSAVGLVTGWNLYRSADATGSFSRINDAAIAMGEGGSFHYRDASPGTGNVTYQLAGVMADGSERVIGTQILSVNGAPTAFAFAVSGSNPFRSGTTFSYALPKSARVTIGVYNIAGAKVRTLVSRVEDAGVHSVSFDRGDGGRVLSPGVYMVRITAGEFQKSLHVIALQ